MPTPGHAVFIVLIQKLDEFFGTFARTPDAGGTVWNLDITEPSVRAHPVIRDKQGELAGRVENMGSVEIFDIAAGRPSPIRTVIEPYQQRNIASALLAGSSGRVWGRGPDGYHLDPGGILAPHVQPLVARLNKLLGGAENTADEIRRRVLIGRGGGSRGNGDKIFGSHLSRLTR